MDPDGNIDRNDLKRPRQGSLDDEPDRPAPEHPDGTHRAQVRHESEGHLAHDTMMTSRTPYSSMAGGQLRAAAEGSNSLVPTQGPGSDSSTLSPQTILNQTNISGGNLIENHGTLNLNFHPQTSSPAPGTCPPNLQGLQSLRRDLEPSTMADYKYHAEGQDSQLLRRAICTPGTRIRILEAIRTWAQDTSATAESVYWLFGSAGSGKSTIAYTVATQTATSAASTTLGSNFFCSRQFDSTRHSKRIVPTLAYHLAHQCPSFAEALAECNFDVVHQNPRAQLEEFLAKPWLQSAEARASDPSSPPTYLIIIDALDEIEGEGGTDFLRTLLDTINARQLPGLRFFVTSRPNPAIVQHVESFEDRKLYRLEEVPMDEAEADIETYLNTALPHFKGSKLMRKLVQLAAGLFIFAATVAKHLTLRYPAPREQRIALKKLISATTLSSAIRPLDQLYIQVLTEAFGNLDEDILASRLRFVHAFLCAAEPTSTTAISRLLPDDHQISDGDSGSEGTPLFTLTTVVHDVVQRLYSVLYIENGKVFSYHKSFPDFMFDKDRSGRFWCDQTAQHQLLASSCLERMIHGLRFNIANILSSYILDKDNPALQDVVRLAQAIPLDLRYACRHWAHHLDRSQPHNNNDTPLLSSLSNFIRLPALFWIEAMSILGWAASCYTILHVVHDCIPQENPELQQAFREAANFALYFSSSPASSSTPHLYISALATWNRSTFYPVAEWKSHFPGIPQFTSSPFRTSALMTIHVGTGVPALAVSSNGKLIAGGSYSGPVQIWDGLTGVLLQILEGHAEQVLSVSFFTDNKRIVSASMDTTIRIWEFNTGKEIRVLVGHQHAVRSAAVSPDGIWVVSGSDDQSVRLWDVETGNLVRVLEGHTERVNSVAFSNSPTPQICSGSDDGTICIWDAKSSQVHPKAVLRGLSEEVFCVAFSPVDHSVVSASARGAVWTWDPVTHKGKHLALVVGEDEGFLGSFALSRDGSKFVSGAPTGEVQIWDSGTGDIVGVLGVFPNPVSAGVFSFDGKRVVVASYDGSIQVWDAAVGHSGPHIPGRLGYGRWTTTEYLAVSYDGTKILSASEDGSIRLWDPETGDLLHDFLGGPTADNAALAVAFSKDDSSVLAISEDNVLRRWDSLTGNILDTIEGGSYNWPAAISSRGSHTICAMNSEDHDNVNVYIRGISTGEAVELGKHEAFVTAVALSRDGKCAGTGTFDGTAFVWDVSSERAVCRWSLDGHSSSIESITFSYDCSRAASASENICVWDMATGDCLWVLDEHERDVTSISFSPDPGHILASGSRDHTIRVWDIQTGRVQAILNGHREGVKRLAFFSNGKRVISCSDDGTIRVWNVSPSGTETKGYSVEKLVDPFGSGVSGRTGWLLDGDSSNLLMCVPLDDMVPDPSNICVIPRSADPSLSYSRTTLGPNWQSCYSLTR